MIWHRSGVNSKARTVRTSSPQLFQFPFLLQQIDERDFFSAFCIRFTALSKWWLFVLITYKCCFFPLAATVNCCHILCFFFFFFFWNNVMKVTFLHGCSHHVYIPSECDLYPTLFPYHGMHINSHFFSFSFQFIQCKKSQ